ncbi:hypothetical protein VL20_5024 [Microcystis panniformis FACHB-1757]|uniref:Uncharacterized protein n=1 Tax=Microcystis panniformis FACHB-1757 TaxID=1638788 RepID=A0A0K1S6X1_9CHRO|nr:hypothetical protein VL20_5024 [Microcystis panniformis FACHB-1757]
MVIQHSDTMSVSMGVLRRFSDSICGFLLLNAYQKIIPE